MDFNWKDILAALGTVGGALVVGVPFFKWISELIEKKREEKKGKKKQEFTESVELRKIEIDDRARINEDLWQIIEAKDKEYEKLEKKVEQLENSQSLPRPKMTIIYQGMRKISKQVDVVRTLVEHGEAKENIISELDILDQKINEVDSLLP